MNIIEYGSNWIIQDKLDDKLINEIKDFFDSHIDFLYKDKEGYSTTGNNSEQYWLKREYGKLLLIIKTMIVTGKQVLDFVN